MPPPPAEPTPPHIPDYKLLRRIGAGSYGDVWIARTATGVFRAVKVVWRERFEDAGPYEREFRGLREFERVSLVQPRQLALLHVARRDEDGFFYYVMELADDAETGDDIDPATYRPLTLRELRREGAMTVARTLELGVEMARGLAVLHEHGLVHRDIKPSNVVLVGGVPKLADIGLVASATMALTFVGTEGFVAPEGPGAPAADVFALGKVLYELVTGLDRIQFPQLPEDFAAREDRIAFLELNAVVLRACEPDLKRRPENARMLLDDLLLVQAGKSVRRLWAAERGLARALKTAAVLAAIAAVAGAGAWVAWNRAQQEMALRAEAEAERDALARQTQYAGLMAQASRAVERGDSGLARRGLLAAKEALAPVEPGFEWDWLWDDSWGGAARVYREQGSPINRVVLSPDGRFLATADSSARVRVYDVETGEQRWEFRKVGDLAGWSADGRWLMGVNEKAHAFAVEVETGERRDSDGPFGLIWPLGVGRDGRMLSVEARGGGRLVSYEYQGGEEQVVASLFPAGKAEGWTFFRHAFSNDQRRVAVAWVRNFGVKAEFCLTVLDLDDATSAHQMALATRPGVLGWSGDEQGTWKLEVVNDLTGEVAWWSAGADMVTPQPTRAVGSGAERSFEVDGGDRLHVRADGAVMNVRIQAMGRRWSGHSGPVSSVVVDPVRARVYSGDGNGGVLRWDLRTERQTAVKLETKNHWVPIALSPDGERFYAPKGDEVVAYGTTTRDIEQRFPRLAAAFKVDAHRIWGVGPDRRTLLEFALDAPNEPLSRFDLGENYSGVTVAKHGRFCFTTIKGDLWVGDRLDALRLVGNMGFAWSSVTDAVASKLWMADQQGVDRVLCRSTQSAEVVWEQRVAAQANSLALDEPANELYASLKNGEIWVFDATTGEVKTKIQSGASSVYAMALTPDRERLVFAGPHGEVHVMERATRLHLGMRQLPLEGIISTLIIDESGNTLLASTFASEVLAVSLR